MGKEDPRPVWGCGRKERRDADSSGGQRVLMEAENLVLCCWRPVGAH